MRKGEEQEALKKLIQGLMTGQGEVKEEKEPDYFGDFSKAKEKIDRYKIVEEERDGS